MEILFIIFVAFTVIVMIILANGRPVFENQARRAGRKAEINAREWIEDQLNEEDVLLCNVEIIYDGMRTELDDVIVNSYGVFIVEVKYYSGELEGDENDREWTKYHMSSGYNVYVKSVRNPIIQLKREIHILANYLREQGFNVWVKGYVLLTENNSPVESEYILNNVNDLRRLIHTADRKRLNRSTVEGIREVLISYND